MSRVAASLGALLAVATVAAPAPADETDACIASAEKSQVERRSGHLGAARELLVSCAADVCPAVIRRDCLRWLAEVEAATPSIVLRATDGAGEDVREGDVRIDGAPRTGVLDGRALPLDPGPHNLEVQGRGFTVERALVMREGERDRVISIRLAAPLSGQVDGPKISVPRGAWILGGAGVAVISAGVVLWGVGLGERSHLYDTCGVDHGCSNDRIDGARSKLVAGDVVFGIGAAAAGAAIVWSIATPSRSIARSAIALAPRPSGASLIFDARF